MSARRMAWLLLLTAISATVPALTPAPSTAQQEIVDRGNQAYQDGRWADAIEAYGAVLGSGYRSAGLEYNMGNAYFKSGELGRAILHWERALELSPSDPDVRANLELARSRTVDAVEPMPRFWLASVAAWWIGFLPRGWLIGLVTGGWLALCGGVATRILVRSPTPAAVARWATIVGAMVLVMLGPSLLVRETGVGVSERAIVLADVVPVRSAPTDDDDLTLFEIHEGTRVRIDQRAAGWVEVVLDDGKVGWIPEDAFEVI